MAPILRQKKSITKSRRKTNHKYRNALICCKDDKMERQAVPGREEKYFFLRRAFSRKGKDAPRFNDLPEELVSEILAKVAASSIDDLKRATETCKMIHEAASNNYVFEHVTLKKVPVIPWRPMNAGAASFLERCLKSGNPEALFRQGMVDFFSEMKPDSGLQYLERAASKGQAEAIYVRGIILVCYGGSYKQEGLKLLSSLTSRKPRCEVIRECRSKVKGFLDDSKMWIRNYIVGFGPDGPISRPNHDCKEKLCPCTTASTSSSSSLWSCNSDFELEEKYATRCDSCFWSREAILFCHMIRDGMYKPTKCFCCLPLRFDLF